MGYSTVVNGILSYAGLNCVLNILLFGVANVNGFINIEVM